MTEAEIITRSKRELIDSIPKMLVYAGTAFMIWLFSKLVFAPLGHITLWGSIEASDIVVSIAIVAIFILLLKILREIRDICDAVAGFVAYIFEKNATTADFLIYQKAIRSVAYVIVVAVVFLFFSSLLDEIHPAISGIVLIIIFLWAVLTLYSAGMMISAKIEAGAKRFTEKVLKAEEKSGERPLPKK